MAGTRSRFQTVYVEAMGLPQVVALANDLAEALALVAEMFSQPLPTDWEARARELLDRNGVQRQACPDSSLLAWGLHEIDPDGRWEA